MPMACFLLSDFLFDRSLSITFLPGSSVKDTCKSSGRFKPSHSPSFLFLNLFSHGSLLRVETIQFPFSIYFRGRWFRGPLSRGSAALHPRLPECRRHAAKRRSCMCSLVFSAQQPVSFSHCPLVFFSLSVSFLPGVDAHLFNREHMVQPFAFLPLVCTDVEFG